MGGGVSNTEGTLFWFFSEAKHGYPALVKKSIYTIQILKKLIQNCIRVIFNDPGHYARFYKYVNMEVWISLAQMMC